MTTYLDFYGEAARNRLLEKASFFIFSFWQDKPISELSRRLQLLIFLTSLEHTPRKAEML